MTRFDEFSALSPVETDEVLKSVPGYKRSRRRDYGRSNGTRKELRPFVSWDGEGAGDGKNAPQDYCIIGNSEGGILRTDAGYLPSVEIFNWLLAESARMWGRIHVAYGFNYDVNQMLRDVPFPILRRIHAENVAHWRGYRIEWFPGKWFMLSHKQSDRSIRIYDTIGFWHTRLDKAIESEPKLRDDPRLALIKEGKQDRGTFLHSEIDEKIVPYFQAEMELHAALCECLRETLGEVEVPYGGKEGNLVPNEWYGPSAIVKTLYAKAGLKRAMNRPVSDLTRPRRHRRGRPQIPDPKFNYTLPDQVNAAARAAFAGGRFEQYKLGYYEGEVYGYDITSAYPDAQKSLLQLAEGKWHYVERDELWQIRKTHRHPPFGFYWIYYDFKRVRGEKAFRRDWLPGFVQPGPLFNRDYRGVVSYPPETFGWYPANSANIVWQWPGVEIVKAWIWEPDKNSEVPLKPFNDREMVNFPLMFAQRDYYGSIGRDDLKYALKITLNSGYGKTAQKTGVMEGDNLPAFHQIEWAAHITDHCREKIFSAAMAAFAADALVSIETDAIYTTKRIPYLDRQVRDGLGYWKREEYSGICYLASGIYFTRGTDGKWGFHNRGLDRDSFDIETVRSHLSTIRFREYPWESLGGRLSNFAGMGMAGIGVVNHPTQFYAKWLRWPSTEKEVRLGPHSQKRGHDPKWCKACADGVSPADGLHDLVVPWHYGGLSHSRKYLWIPEETSVDFADAIEERWS